MGASAVLEQTSQAKAAREGTDVGELLQELHVAIPGIRDALQVLFEECPEAEDQTLANEIKDFAARASAHQQALVAQELSYCEAILRGAAVLGSLSSADMSELHESLARVESYIEAAREMERTPTSGPVPAVLPTPAHILFERDYSSGQLLASVVAVLVVGPESLARLVQTPIADVTDGATVHAPEPELEVEHVDNTERAFDLARALAPDLIVVDAELKGAQQLFERLHGGAYLAAVPVIAVGRWERVEQAGPLLERGVARVLTKPVSPRTLRKACFDVVANNVRLTFEALGQTTVEQLGERLSNELRRGLCDAADEQTCAKAMDLGNGGEIQAVLWGAISRIRELVTAASQGEVRFMPIGPGAALPAPPWLVAAEHHRRAGHMSGLVDGQRAIEQQSLAGRRIVVADDDLSVSWFLTGVLREAGATVYDAIDGQQALRYAYQHAPDLIISDIIMPRLDGIALCRAVKRDVVLRNVPVVLLSWKDDLLQRVRELGVGADAYLRKGASGAAIVQQVAEVLQPRAQVAAAIARGAPTHGRLDGLTGYLLLRLACQNRPNSRLTVRDAIHLYEIEIRGGRPVSAVRTTVDGNAERGPKVLAALLGLGAGQFGLSDTSEAVAEQLSGSLDEQLLKPIANARAALTLLSGSGLVRVERVVIDETVIEVILNATPEPAKGLLRAIIGGASPRELISAGRASANLLEDVLSDAARHGAVTGITGPGGTNELRAAMMHEMCVLTGEVDELDGQALLPLVSEAEGEEPAPLAAEPAAEHDEPWSDDDGQDVLDEAPQAWDESAPVVAFAAMGQDDGSAADTAEHEPWEDDSNEEPVADAPADDVCAEQLLSAPAAEPSHESPPLAAEPSSRPSNPHWPPPAAAPQPPTQQARHTPVLASGLVGAVPAARPTPVLASGVAGHGLASPAELDPWAVPDPRFLHPGPEQVPAVPASAQPALGPLPPPELAPSAAVAHAPQHQPTPIPPRMPVPSAYLPQPAPTEPPAGRKRNRWLLPLMFGVFGISLAVGARWMRDGRSTNPPPPAAVSPPTATAPVAAAPASPPGAAEATAAPPAAEQSHNAELPTEYPLTDEDEVGKGEGLLEVVAGRTDKIYVNGQLIGQGPIVKVALKAVPDPYEVRVKLRGEERVRYAVVKQGKRVRLRVAPPWSR